MMRKQHLRFPPSAEGWKQSRLGWTLSLHASHIWKMLFLSSSSTSAQRASRNYHTSPWNITGLWENQCQKLLQSQWSLPLNRTEVKRFSKGGDVWPEGTDHHWSPRSIVIFWQHGAYLTWHFCTEKGKLAHCSKENALPSIKKIFIYYVIESFEVSITFTGLKICLTQLWKLARQTQRSAKMNSALFAVIMPGCGLAVLTDQEAANVQARRQATVRTVHLSSLAGIQSSAASPQFHLWKCPFLSFSFKIWQKLPETAVLPINSEPGGRGRNHQTHTHPKTNSNSSDFHGGKSEAGFSGQPYFP